MIRATETRPEFVQLPWDFSDREAEGSADHQLFSWEMRRFPEGRCPAPVSWFDEFTGKKYPKTKWRFSMPDEG